MKFGTWNLERGLSDSPENRSTVALRVIDEIDTDVLVLPEAYDHQATMQTRKMAANITMFLVENLYCFCKLDLVFDVF